MEKFKKMTFEEIQKIRNKYSDKISKIANEFKSETDLEIESIDQFDSRNNIWFINIRKVI